MRPHHLLDCDLLEHHTVMCCLPVLIRSRIMPFEVGKHSFCRGKRTAQAFFNTLFTMDLWYDLTTFIHLAFVGSKNSGYVLTVVLYSLFVPLDNTNLFIRTGYCLEDIPERSHLFNLIFEIPMLLFNIYVLTQCVPLFGLPCRCI